MASKVMWLVWWPRQQDEDGGYTTSSVYDEKPEAIEEDIALGWRCSRITVEDAGDGK